MAPGSNARHRADVVDDLSHQTPFIPRATREMAEKNISFKETEAGKALESDVERLNKKLEDMEKEMLDKTKALDDQKKDMREVAARHQKDMKELQDNFDAEMAKEKQRSKDEQARMAKMLEEGQAKAASQLKTQYETSEAKMRAMMDRASAERLDMQRQHDYARNSWQQSIDRLGNLVSEETSARRTAEQRVSTLQQKVRELERAWAKIDKENDKLLDQLIEAADTEERLRNRIRKLQR